MADHLAGGDVRSRWIDVAEPTGPGGAGGPSEAGKQGLGVNRVFVDVVICLIDDRLVETGTCPSCLIDDVGRDAVAHRVVHPAFGPARGSRDARAGVA